MSVRINEYIAAIVMILSVLPGTALAGEKVQPIVKDRFIPAPFEGQKIGGMLGERFQANLKGRLLHVDEARLLGGFQKRPGSHDWIGEHIGKYLEAASYSWRNTGDPALESALRRMVPALLATQLEDGYLGTYNAEIRWKKWDVWVHKYDLIGLLAWHEATGDRQSLEAAIKIGDLLCRTFGEQPGQLDIIKAGEHVGMAATSVLEPMCHLYRLTGDPRYLEFCRYILRSYDQPHGPRIVQSLLQTGNVLKTANAKAYEMLPNLVGMLELYRLTGDQTLLKATTNAWEDIVKKRLYLTGTTSAGEHFLDDYELLGEGDAHVGEGCVTTTWVQLNWHLLRLTGESKYGDELEKTVYNHLLAAQDPETGNACYFTNLSGRKGFGPGISCCVSSIPRAIALIPELTWGTMDGGVLVNLYTAGEARLTVGSVGASEPVTIRSETDFPVSGQVTLAVSPQRSLRFPLYLRVPSWATGFKAVIGGRSHPGRAGELLKLERVWSPGDFVKVTMDLPVRVHPGDKSNPEAVAIQRGPQVLAIEQSLNGQTLPILSLAAPRFEGGVPQLQGLTSLPAGWSSGAQVYEMSGLASVPDAPGKARRVEKKVLMVPFADAHDCRVWLPNPSRLPEGPVSLTVFGKESWSREGDANGSFADGRLDTFRRTFNYTFAAEDWYAVELPQPTVISRVVYAHGRSERRGGWFDTSEGKPRIQVKKSRDGDWETIATVDSYPTVESGKKPDIPDGHQFEVKLGKPVQVTAIRIIGKPGSIKKGLVFSSCAELSAF